MLLGSLGVLLQRKNPPLALSWVCGAFVVANPFSSFAPAALLVMFPWLIYICH